MRILAVVISLLLLSGCSGKNTELQRAMELRTKLLGACCTFDAEITADYGSSIQTFRVYCEGNAQGNLGFSVTAPESIQGITGRIESGEGKLTFQDTALAFPLLAEEQLSPVSSPWIFWNTLRSGYLTAAGMEDDLLRLTIDESYEEDALTVDIWLDAQDKPIRAEILYVGRRILTLTIENFQIV